MKAKSIFKAAFFVLLLVLWIYLSIRYNIVFYIIHP